jgi:hypothetical protein
VSSRTGASYALGGRLRIEAGGSVSVTNDVFLSAAGLVSAGGDLIITAVGDINLVPRTGDLTGAADGGIVSLRSTSGSIIAGGSVDVSGRRTRGASGGYLDLDAAGDVVLGGEIVARGNPTAAGNGGHVTAIAGSRLTIVEGAQIDLRGGNRGRSGTMTARTGGDFLQDEGTWLRLGGVPAGFAGGSLDLRVGGDARLAKIDLDAVRGGRLTASAEGDLRVIGRIAAGSTLATGVGGSVSLRGCDLTVENGGEIDSLGREASTRGTNSLAAGGTLVVEGRLLASQSNELRYKISTPVVSGMISPAPNVVLDPTLPDCHGP